MRISNDTNRSGSTVKGTGLKGTGFSPYIDGQKSSWALQVAEKLRGGGFVSGHDFSRADKANEMDWVLTPEGCFSRIHRLSKPFSAIC